jgi:hypothetical protein
MKRYFIVALFTTTLLSASYAYAYDYAYLECWDQGNFEYATYQPDVVAEKPYIDIGLISKTYEGYTDLRGNWGNAGFVIDFTFNTKNDARNFCFALQSQCKKEFGIESNSFLAHYATWYYVNVTYGPGYPLSTNTCDYVMLPD